MTSDAWEGVGLGGELAGQSTTSYGRVPIDVSPGELLDRLSILTIKAAASRNTPTEVPVESERLALQMRWCTVFAVNPQQVPEWCDLLAINRTLWMLEDDVRTRESVGDFGPLFVSSARAIYATNDRRWRCKEAINERLRSELRECKFHAAPLAEWTLRSAWVVRPSPWMCFRTWRSPAGECLSMLTNERDHELATLDGPSAELWAQIEEGIGLDGLRVYAARLGVAEHLDDFLAMLCERGFIASPLTDVGLDDRAAPVRAAPAPIPRPLERGENGDAERDIIQWVTQNGLLFSAHWEVTYRCNERCVHCYNPGAAHTPTERPERETEELTPAEAVSLLDDLREVGVLRLTLSGGEVMLRHDFWDLVAAARARGFSVNVYTNGLKLDEAACDRLAALWPSTVSISVYSADADAHDAITGVPGSFQKSVRALEWLHERGIKTYLKSTQMKHTVGGYARVNELAARLGAGGEVDMMMSAAVDGASAPLALAQHAPEELVVLAATPGSPLDVGDASSGYGRQDRDPKATVCGAGTSSMGIDPTGGINPCNSLPIPVGSHRTHGFREIWRASRHYRRTHRTHVPPATVVEAVAPLSQWQEVRLESFHECGTHRRCGWCTKCPGLAMLEHGDPLAPSTTNCRLATARMMAADLLGQGLTREDIAARLQVPTDFGRRRGRSLPVLQETVRGQGFDPKETASSAMLGVGGNARTSVGFIDRHGTTLLRRGSKATRDMLAEFDTLDGRLEDPLG